MFNVIIGHAVKAPEHRKDVVGGLNTVDKISIESNVSDFSSRRKTYIKAHLCSHRNSELCNKSFIGRSKTNSIKSI